MNLSFLRGATIDNQVVGGEALMIAPTKGIMAFDFKKGSRLETVVETCIHMVSKLHEDNPKPTYISALGHLNRAYKELKDQRRIDARRNDTVQGN